MEPPCEIHQGLQMKNVHTTPFHAHTYTLHVLSSQGAWIQISMCYSQDSTVYPMSLSLSFSKWARMRK